MNKFLKTFPTVVLVSLMAAPAMPQANSPAITIGGGHDTLGVDRGRPVILVAAGLGVPPQVFRDAFSHVRPAPAGQEPDPEQVRRNKRALMDALAKYGVTNELLDSVSNYYRYPPGRGNIWRNRVAKIEAIVKGNAVTGFRVVDGGAGYTSVPTISVEGHPEVKAVVTVAYGKDLKTNGSISKVELINM